MTKSTALDGIGIGSSLSGVFPLWRRTRVPLQAQGRPLLPVPTARRRFGVREGPELLEELRAFDALHPRLHDPAAGQTVDADPRHLYRPLGGRQGAPEQGTAVGAAVRAPGSPAGDDQVSLGDLRLDRAVVVREGRAQSFGGALAGLDPVGLPQLVDHRQVAPVEHLLEEPADEGLVRRRAGGRLGLRCRCHRSSPLRWGAAVARRRPVRARDHSRGPPVRPPRQMRQGHRTRSIWRIWRRNDASGAAEAPVLYRGRAGAPASAAGGPGPARSGGRCAERGRTDAGGTGVGDDGSGCNRRGGGQRGRGRRGPGLRDAAAGPPPRRGADPGGAGGAGGAEPAGPAAPGGGRRPPPSRHARCPGGGARPGPRRPVPVAGGGAGRPRRSRAPAGVPDGARGRRPRRRPPPIYPRS